MKDILNDLTVTELAMGYVKNELKNHYQCIFCSKKFDKGVIYFSRGRNVDAHRAVLEHIYDEHEGSFESLLYLDKEINGLSDIQKAMLKSMYDGDDNKEISYNMGVKLSTVRAHKFKLQQLKREAKILLALFEHLENEKVIECDNELNAGNDNVEHISFNHSFSRNVLHPFFTQINLK